MTTKLKIQREIFGTLPDVTFHQNVLNWKKTGGYAGKKTLARIVQRAIGNGFVKVSAAPTGTPDGSHMGTGEAYTGPNGERLVVASSYGVTKDKNYFSANLYLNG